MSKSEPTQTQIGAFDQSDSETSQTKPETDTETKSEQPTETEDNTPDNPTTGEVEWDSENPIEVNNVKTYPPVDAEEIVSFPGDSIIRKGEMLYLVDDKQDYLNNTDSHKIPIPTSYTKFADKEPIITSKTAESRHGYYGVLYRKIEPVVRFLAGKGGFSSSKLDVYGGNAKTFLVSYGQENILVGTDQIKSPENDYEADTFSLLGTEIPEENAGMREALRRFVDIMDDTFSGKITGYNRMRANKHYFDVDQDEHDEIYITGFNLRAFLRATTDKDELLGERTLETAFDEEYTTEIKPEHIECDIGDKIRRDGTVLGFQATYEDPRRSSRVSLSGRVKMSVTTHYYTIRSGGEIRTGTRAETVEEFETENEDYDPIDSHL